MSNFLFFQTVMCIASICVAEMPPSCEWEACKPVTKCEGKHLHSNSKKIDWLLLCVELGFTPFSTVFETSREKPNIVVPSNSKILVI